VRKLFSLIKIQAFLISSAKSRGPFISSTGDYFIYRDTWVMQHHSKLPSEGLCSWTPENLSVAPRGPRVPFAKPWPSHYSCSRFL